MDTSYQAVFFNSLMLNSFKEMHYKEVHVMHLTTEFIFYLISIYLTPLKYASLLFFFFGLVMYF